MIEYQCKMCGATITTEKAHNIRIFCSRQCQGAFLQLKSVERDKLQNVPRMGKLVDINEDGGGYLVGAIVKQASRDYVKLPVSSAQHISAKNFFCSDYFERLTGLDGGEMLAKLEEERRERHRNRKRGTD